jgi:hypothetical protein
VTAAIRAYGAAQGLLSADGAGVRVDDAMCT